MASIPQALVRMAALWTACCLQMGCVAMHTWLPEWETPPAVPVGQLAVTWDNNVHTSIDPRQKGMGGPTLAGRLYLLDAEAGKPVLGDGTLSVELYDLAKLEPNGKPKLIESWQMSAKTLHNMQRKDLFGPGYTLMLPWDKYDPHVSKVNLMVCYTPRDGFPLYAPSAPITLVHAAQPAGPGPTQPSAPAPQQLPAPRVFPALPSAGR